MHLISTHGLRSLADSLKIPHIKEMLSKMEDIFVEATTVHNDLLLRVVYFILHS